MKYIVTVLAGKKSIFLFPKEVEHNRMAEAIQAIRFGSKRNWQRKFRQGEVIGAGFVDSGICYGRSETLNLESRGEADTALLIGLKAGN